MGHGHRHFSAGGSGKAMECVRFGIVTRELDAILL